jgi:hypothetical protein
MDNYLIINRKNKARTANISYPQVRQRWFSVCIFPLVQLFGLTENRPQSALRVAS